MATSMSSNKLVWVGVALLVGLVAVAAINASNSDKPDVPRTQSKNQNEDQKKSKSEDGDTVVETLKEVQAKYEKSEREKAELAEKFDKMERTLNRLANKKTGDGFEPKEDPRVAQLTEFVGALQNQVSTLTDEMTNQTKDRLTGANGYEVTDSDLGIEGQGNGKSKRNALSLSPQALPGYVTVKPMTRTQLLTMDPKLAEKMVGKELKLPSGLPSAKNSQSGFKSVSTELAPPKPYYTIPKRATGFEAVAMTALIGTVPVGGKVQDPFPARFILGGENLATNGIRIPGLKGIVFDGIARGNWNLSCVSVTLTGATYTFQDGRVQHMEFGSNQGGQKNLSQSPFSEAEGNRGIGYIADPYGTPCIAGERISDAPKKLAAIGFLGAAKSYFDAKAAAETTSNENVLGGSSTSVTGNKAAFVENETYGNTVETVMDFANRRWRDTFDVVFVKPNQKVSLMITHDLLIDYHSDARKVAYNQGETSHVNSMD
jgi:integrating conjugative element protein (TIGR03752 family)